MSYTFEYDDHLEQNYDHKDCIIKVAINMEVVDRNVMNPRNLEFPILDTPAKSYDFFFVAT